MVRYLLLSTVCLSLFYITYRLFLANEHNFRFARMYLLLSMVFSLIIPLNNYSINVTIPQQEPSADYFTGEPATQLINDAKAPMTSTAQSSFLTKLAAIDKSDLLFWLYLSISMIFMIRILIQLSVLMIQYHMSNKVRQPDCILIYNHRFKNTFSFFRWVFIQPGLAKEDEEHILLHERIHVNQHHSFDLIMIQLLTTVMWFNPFMWMMKNSLQLIHEFLADEGVLSTGIERTKYQALLINQISEEKLICLSSSFNYSLIKKRMMMITSSKMNRKRGFGILSLIPVMTSLFLIVSVYNGFFAEVVSGNTKEKLYFPADDPITATTPSDTVKKTVITKVYVNKDSNDTIVNKEVRIISGKNHADKHMESEDIRITGYGSRQNIHVSSDNHDDDDVFIITEDGNNSTHRVLIKSDTVITHEVMNENENSNDDIRVITKTVKIRSSGDHERSRILYIINGVPSGHRDPISTIDPVDIEKIEVIKDKEIPKHISKGYDPEDYDALIVITTKEHKK